MTKTPIPLHVDDLTGFARALNHQLGEASPPHLSLMNMLARAAGFQNLQHMRASNAAKRRIETRPDAEPLDMRTVERAFIQFDAAGCLKRWPSRRAVQTLALWALWASIPAGISLTETEVNERLGQEHLFDDPATLRRTMISCGLLTRQIDGSDYRRIEQSPSPEAQAVIREVTLRRRNRAAVGAA
ncbi:DUF2087 domain-containing protein [Ruegeria sp. SCPT10]|uniref:DUF2087 domain-containing protein n=1 Tax=Ruegeria sp. SCP10 TaxID=3141377 RepID=UPI0033352F74